jgi:Domain of unknown function (DUF4331)
MALPRLLRSRKAAAVAAAAALAATGAGLAPGIGSASSHREAPLIAGEPQLDNTDVYAFVSPDKPDSVTLIANWIPLEEPNGGPNFYPFADRTAYDIKIDNNGDGVEDLTYRWTFRHTYQDQTTFLYNTDVVTSLDDKDLNFRQFYNLDLITPAMDKHGRVIKDHFGQPVQVSHRLATDVPAAPSNTGAASMPNYKALADAAVRPFGSGGRTFAGQADESFFLDLRVFDLLYGGNLSEVGHDTLTGYNVNTIALQVPKAALALKNNATRNPVVGIWSTTSRPKYDIQRLSGRKDLTGDLRQVSRLGMPLVNEVVVPLVDKDKFNASKPINDGQFLKYVDDPIVPKLIEKLYKIPAPFVPDPKNANRNKRTDLEAVFLTGVPGLNSPTMNKDVDPGMIRPAEMLRLNMSIAPAASPKRLGVLDGDTAGFPNGRRLSDDVLDVTVQAAEGVLLPGTPAAVKGLGDGVNANDVPFRTQFPYLALPSNKAVNQH